LLGEYLDLPLLDLLESDFLDGILDPFNEPLFDEFGARNLALKGVRL
jgi:hypothetical protein